MIRSAGLLTCAVLVLTVLYGCTVFNRLNPKEQAAEEHAERVRVLQLKVMRFADQYAGRQREAINSFQAGLRSPEDRLQSQSWKLQQAESAYTIATGPDAVANALDMVVLATLSRMVLDDAWVTDMYGPRARPVQQVYQSLEADAWDLLKDMLTSSQIERLHALINDWRAKHPEVRVVAYIHFVDFAKAAGASSGEQKRPDDLLAVVGLNPLAGLDPAVQQIAQTRELAERSIYYIQRMPSLLQMQIELLVYQSAAMPETKSLLSDISRVSLIGSASDRLVSTLPDVLDRQREGAIKDLMRALNDQSATVSALAGQLRATLQAGTDTANAVHGALDTVDTITTRFAPTPRAPSEPRGPPFDIRQYTALLQQATLTARELNMLAQSTDSMLPSVRSATRDAVAQMVEVENHLFVLLALLVLIAAAAALLAALAYRRITVRLDRRDST